MSEPSQELVVPGLGTLVNLDKPEEVALALDDIRDLEQQFRYLKNELTERLVHESGVQGSKTLHLPGVTATIKSGVEWEYDAEVIEIALRNAGMPEDRIREIVKETVSYKVDAVKAKQAAAANPVYAEIVEGNRTRIEAKPYVTISRKPNQLPEKFPGDSS